MGNVFSVYTLFQEQYGNTVEWVCTVTDDMRCNEYRERMADELSVHTFWETKCGWNGSICRMITKYGQCQSQNVSIDNFRMYAVGALRESVKQQILRMINDCKMEIGIRSFGSRWVRWTPKDQNVGDMLNVYTLNIGIWTDNVSYPLIVRGSDRRLEFENGDGIYKSADWIERSVVSDPPQNDGMICFVCCCSWYSLLVLTFSSRFQTTKHLLTSAFYQVNVVKWKYTYLVFANNTIGMSP